MKMKKLYVITRNDLGTVYASVQGGHAVAQWMINYPEQKWNNEYLIYLAVDDENAMKNILMKVHYKEDNVAVFHEPDLGGQLTAFTCYTDSKIFDKLKLLGV